MEDWQELYGRLAGNELHSIVAENSKFFQELIGKPFPLASYIAHEKYDLNFLDFFFVVLMVVFMRRFNVCLVAIGTKQKKSRKQSMFDNEIIIQEVASSNVDVDFSNKDLLINPGIRYIIEADDICVYISLIKEENYDFKNIFG